MSETPELKQSLARVEALIHDAEKIADLQLRGQIQELVAHLLEFHGDAIAKMVEDVADLGVPGRALIDAWTGDERVSSLLLLYDLHPVDIESRVRTALEQVRPYLRSHGGNVEYLGLADGVVHLRLQGHCHGCPSSTATLRSTIEKAIYEAAPDAAGIEVEGVVPVPAGGTPSEVGGNGFFSLQQIKVPT
jgi:Fe-S cluster biogenesis protein NfuA